MTERVLVIQHDSDSPLGAIDPALRAYGVEPILVNSALERLPSVDGFDGLIVLGGVLHPDVMDEPLAGERLLIAEARERGLPILGLCLGSQLIAQACGGAAGKAPTHEVGWCDMTLTADADTDELFSGLGTRARLFEWHEYRCDPPDGAVVLARNDAAVQAFRVDDRIWGLQCHVEVTSEIVAEWIDLGAGDLARLGASGAAIAAEPPETVAASIATATRIGERFARVVRRVRARATEPA